MQVNSINICATNILNGKCIFHTCIVEKQLHRGSMHSLQMFWWSETFGFGGHRHLQSYWGFESSSELLRSGFYFSRRDSLDAELPVNLALVIIESHRGERRAAVFSYTRTVQSAIVKGHRKMAFTLRS